MNLKTTRTGITASRLVWTAATALIERTDRHAAGNRRPVFIQYGGR